MAPGVKTLAVMPDSLRLILGPVQWKEAVASSELSFDLLVYSHVNLKYTINKLNFKSLNTL